MELVGQRAQALVSRRRLVTLTDSSPVFVFISIALGAQDVAQVPVLEGGVQIFAQRIARHIELDAPTHVARNRRTRWQKSPCPSRLSRRTASHGNVRRRGLPRDSLGGRAMFQVQLRRL